MTSTAKTPAEYYESLPADRKPAMEKLREAVGKNLPEGFSETMSYGMPGWVVPHGLYPSGYHCDPQQALPFIGLASQKNFVAFYHMGIYADPELLDWFVNEYKARVKSKLDMGKSCIRFKKMADIPFDLFGELAAKVTPEQWIETYEKCLKK